MKGMLMSNDTTERVYEFILSYMEAHNGLAPSQREIAEACFLVRSAVLRHLDRLEAWGRIIREPGKARSIRLPSEIIETA
jgi:DNA-binding MarR family transcriptional regulator